MRNVLFLLLLSSGAYGQLSLTQLKNNPSGHIRNFQIWQFMQQDISSEEADAAYCLVNGFNQKIFKAYARKSKDPLIKEKYRCTTLPPSSLVDEDNVSCINQGFSLRGALKLSARQRDVLAEKIASAYPRKSEQLRLLNSNNLVLDLLNSGAKNYLALFNSLGAAYRQQHFNVKLSSERINELAQHKAFNSSIKYIVTDAKMHRMQEALLALQPHELSAQSYFFLALNALKFKATKKASLYLEMSHKKAYYRIDKDRAVFWQYLIHKERAYLQELSKSSDINIYTLYAKEKLGIEVNNYFIRLPLKDSPSAINLNNPYQWQNLLETIRASDQEELHKLLQQYSNKEDEVLCAFIYAKSTQYKLHNYIMPYDEATKDLSNDDKALLYALAKQESHFIPSALSRSYALGVMQLMPFLIKALAKQKKEQISLEEMFDPVKNIDYAKTHIQYLQRHLYHPLFIAYAYNGGIGFTKRHLLKGTFTEGSFEPFLSMELIANTESREYGKKVLANYVIYKKILKEEISITALFEMLTQPSHTDRFRTKDL